MNASHKLNKSRNRLARLKYRINNPTNPLSPRQKARLDELSTQNLK